ncbi:MAG: electron transport complex subunit RsxA [Prevotellaceae bacterium]|jgi:electron transport complex protein RnfA|nr:electron transport complex subunit RsxA [Prevotellaceae bacterium]
MEYILLLIAAIFVNNVLLSQFLGICPFLGVSNKVTTSMGMGGAVVFVLTISSIATYLIQYFILVPLKIEYMQTIIFILVIATLVQMVEIILKKVSPTLYQALGIFLPLIVTNCAVLGIALLSIQNKYDLAKTTVFSLASGIGFALALVLFAGLREQLELSSNVPKSMKGTPIALIVAGLLAMAFMGFSGVVKL